MRRASLSVAFLLSFLPLSVSAQTIRGVVVDSASGRPVDAGFVLLLGPEGKELARALADREGRFVLRAPAAGRYALRSERIGFKVTTSAPVELAADQTLQYRLVVTAVPVRLEEIVVSGDTRCRVRPDEAQATVTVWEEARKALSAVSWVQRQQRLRVRTRSYRRSLGADSTVITERSSIKSGTATKVYAALPAKELATLGYIRRDPNGDYVFNAPDADVLFSDEFLNGHCFRLRTAEDSSSSYVGLAFEPVSGKLPDIKGVIWLDGKSAELRHVDFKYTGFAFPAETDVAGGRVDFQRLANGGWMVSRFWIRMPTFGITREQRFSSMSDVRAGGRSEARARLTGMQEDGGEVLEVFGTDGRQLAASLGATLEGEVFDSIRSMPLIGARVVLAGAPYEAITGPGGTFHLDGLPEGDYTVQFSHPDFPAWGVLPGVARVMLRRGRLSQVLLAVPSSRNLFSLVCPGIKADTLGAVAGLVRDNVTARPVRDAVIRVSWGGYDVVRTDQITGHRLGMEVGSDSTGYFRACGVPANLKLEARVLVGEGEGRPVETRVAPGELKELNLVR
ncbi:MAG: carboxypeptidase regulatory-like domain-containing protein [Gemmatimonadetes bacterium]|nr:carboxypeptidase regulatory-like domain-containing protein [Gemmatimonadota bacterium]